METAVANILANKKARREQKIKEDLLKISEAINTVQDRKHLLKVIYDRYSAYFPFRERWTICDK